MPVVRVHVLVQGHVQGIGYRAFIQRHARRLNVNGCIRNLRDGSVEAVFEGEDSLVKQLVDLCGHGPPFARVEKVKLDWAQSKAEFDTFQIV